MTARHLWAAWRPNTMLRRASAAVLVAAALVLLVPAVILPVVAPDAEAVPAVERLLPDAKPYLARQLDLGLAHVRYSGAELRARDHLVILEFEIRPFPYVASEGAYLVSRCTPLEQLDPNTMGGGRGVTDFATDAELAYVRSDAQPPCE